MKKILLIDDDADLRNLLKKMLTQNNFICYEASSGKRAQDVLQENDIDLVLCDFRLRDMNGSEVLQAIKETNPRLPVIIMTGYSNVRSAVEVMQLGAVDYIIKPLVSVDILAAIHAALNPSSRSVPLTTPTPLKGSEPFKGLPREPYVLASSEFYRSVLNQIDLVAPTNYCVIIYGESGSGKEAFAQEIHKRSKRKNKPFLAIDCGALSRELAGSTLFGHEKGAFTGALNQKIGSFELAEGGTIFLDEISNLSYEVQVTLLRVVQERKIRRVGGTKDIDIDVRIIVASNQKLWAATKTGAFREDLYHRFNEFTIDVKPLRERKEDILFYADHFLKTANQELGKNVQGFTEDVKLILMNYPWPGNLRELKNAVRRATLLAEYTLIERNILPLELSDPELMLRNTVSKQLNNPGSPLIQRRAPAPDPVPVKMEAEYQTIVATLQETGFDKKVAARLLRMDSKTMMQKVKNYGRFNGLDQ